MTNVMERSQSSEQQAVAGRGFQPEASLALSYELPLTEGQLSHSGVAPNWRTDLTA
jgi:hypothetical protein